MIYSRMKFSPRQFKPEIVIVAIPGIYISPSKLLFSGELPIPWILLMAVVGPSGGDDAIRRIQNDENFVKQNFMTKFSGGGSCECSVVC